MSLPHAILTALLEKPSSGLELTRRFDRSIGFFWSATHQQIYRELGRLEREGLVRASGPAAGRGQRKEYEVLPDGRAALREWVALVQDPKPIRDPLLLRLRAAAVLGVDGLGEELARHRELHREQLAEYLEIERRDFPAERAGEESRLQHLVLRAGIQLESFWLAWLDEALAGPPAERAEGRE
ncbi:PadR family transcriptional regulator [Streptomyces sp. TLI_171]|uniref:PadR family transcriptional regulator n=1 Tax=Streptomyces sp. TLI_171 TaxID=1938859 RepID=UPI000C1971F0|nr:PadR family transcriptional regulator [Streptomyces sp. TLI_171]RKE22291.1 DNA-binding PadR family transcriptional regulator [Streptomyces sp. TLI_171]